MKAPASPQHVPSSLSDQGRLALSPPAGFSQLTRRMKGQQGFACSARLLLLQLSRATPAIPTAHLPTPTLPAPQLQRDPEGQRAAVFTRPIHPSPAVSSSPLPVPRPAQRRPSSTAALIPSPASRPDARWLFLFLFSASFFISLAFCQQPLAARLRGRRSLAPPSAAPACCVLQRPCSFPALRSTVWASSRWSPPPTRPLRTPGDWTPQTHHPASRLGYLGFHNTCTASTAARSRTQPPPSVGKENEKRKKKETHSPPRSAHRGPFLFARKPPQGPPRPVDAISVLDRPQWRPLALRRHPRRPRRQARLAGSLPLLSLTSTACRPWSGTTGGRT